MLESYLYLKDMWIFLPGLKIGCVSGKIKYSLYTHRPQPNQILHKDPLKSLENDYLWELDFSLLIEMIKYRIYAFVYEISVEMGRNPITGFFRDKHMLIKLNNSSRNTFSGQLFCDQIDDMEVLIILIFL